MAEMNVTKIYHWLSDTLSSTRCAFCNSCVYFQNTPILHTTVCNLNSKFTLFTSKHIDAQAYTHKQIKYTNFSFYGFAVYCLM